MIIIAYILIVLGAFFTFFSKMISKAILNDKREPNEADNACIKLGGFVCMVVAAIMILL